MSPVLVTSAFVVAFAAALRSTWSPCGWSMLSTITPITERARGHRFAVTATWFTLGAVVGGAALGLVGAAAAAGVNALGLDVTARASIAVVALLLATILDAFSSTTARFRGVLPHHRRQVNENWLDEFRPWVYAAGFGAQIGTGLATYIMTGGVYLVVVLGALTAQPLTAAGVALTFGSARGAAVWAGLGNSTPAALGSFHRRFAALAEPVRLAVATVYAAVALASVIGIIGIGPAAVPVSLAIMLPLGALAIAAGRAAGTTATAQAAGSTVTPASAPLIAPTSDVRRISEPTTA